MKKLYWLPLLLITLFMGGTVFINLYIKAFTVFLFNPKAEYVCAERGAMFENMIYFKTKGNDDTFHPPQGARCKSDKTGSIDVPINFFAHSSLGDYVLNLFYFIGEIIVTFLPSIILYLLIYLLHKKTIHLHETQRPS